MNVDHSINIGRVLQGGLFTSNFLADAVQEMAEWQRWDDASGLASELQNIFDAFPVEQDPNESQTEDDLIWPILNCLGWNAHLRQQNLTPQGRDDVPDGLLFADDAHKARANGFAEEWRRYACGLAIVESKRWDLPLDRRFAQQATAPSTQMLRYLRRVDDLTEGTLRWGMLTNGAQWRLYYQGARSVSEQFFEIDLAAVFGRAGSALAQDERRYCVKLFALFFGRDAFLPGAEDARTFHQRVLDEGRFYQERVANSLSEVVFTRAFPNLARAIAAVAPDTPLPEVRDAALVLLYRLLFILYAEDRNLLPVRDDRYDDYGLRRVRDDIGNRKARDDVFSETAARYYSAIDDLCRAIDEGDSSIGLPPYNGGLFDRASTPLLAQIRLGDQVVADVVDALSFEGGRYINYRDLSVEQLGSIYERLLEHEVVREGDEIAVRPNVFARKGSGSYYTPDALVRLILKETIAPLVQARMDAFARQVDEIADSSASEGFVRKALAQVDPAEKLLDLKICDPAMGSGHFLVSLVDYLSDHVIAAMAEADSAGYVSPLTERIDAIRQTILTNAEQREWTIDAAQLDDRHIVRRMVLKRCVYGVDKNPMAVELAKVSLWLHTFTAGAPLSFLDHHLRCGDSLFGCWVSQGVDKAMAEGSPLFLNAPIQRATGAAQAMQLIEELTDAEIEEAGRSAELFADMQAGTRPLDAFLSLIHAFEWLDVRGKEDKVALRAFFDSLFGNPVEIAAGTVEVRMDVPGAERFVALLNEAREQVEQEDFLNWQVAFPGVWEDWRSATPRGGFDAVIGNPPWDKVKLQQVEWFAARRPEIARAQRAADRKRMIGALQKVGDSLFAAFEQADERARSAARMARSCGDYPFLARGDINLYSLFVERAMALVKADGVVGLLTPSGIASDKTAAPFFRSVATEGRLRALYDFENRRTRYTAPPFFPDVDSRFKFCAFVARPSPTDDPARCAFFLQDVSELEDEDRCFSLTAEDFASVNPNTGTAPIFRSRRDAELTTAIYRRLPVLVDRSSGDEVKAWPVRYSRMFDMSNDSHLFRTREELEDKEGAYPIGGNRFNSPSGEWVPLYQGRMIHQFDHRAASVVVNPDNVHNAALSEETLPEQKENPNFLATPQYWVPADAVAFPDALKWGLAFRDIVRTTDRRTMIAAAVPAVGMGNKTPVLLTTDVDSYRMSAMYLLANLNAIIFDYVTRQKVQSTNMNLYILEQLPVVPPDHYEATRFGTKTAAEIVRDAVLELTYTAHDMAPFARDLGYDGPPFQWDEHRRRYLRAKLDALFFHLYGITDRDDIRYIYSTFPIVARQETATYDRYLSRDLCLAYMNALTAGDPDAEIVL